MAHLRSTFGGCVAAGFLAIGSVALASPAVPWTLPNGAGPGFTFSDGGSDNGLFGDPFLVGSTFVFTPEMFVALSVNGQPVSRTDRAQVRIDSQPGQFIDRIDIRESGNFSLIGAGGVLAGGGLFVKDLTNASEFIDNLTFTPTFPVITSTGTSGVFTGSASVDLPAGTTSVLVIFNNNLLASSSPGGVSLIQKNLADLRVDVIIPEPASALALLGGSLLMLRRRRDTTESLA